MTTKPTQWSLKLLREEGWHPVVVEHWNPHARIRQDLFGFADILAIRAGSPPLLVQTTSGSNASARRTKILETRLALLAIEAGFEIVVHGWRERTKTLPRRLRVEAITKEDFACRDTPSASTPSCTTTSGTG